MRRIFRIHLLEILRRQPFRHREKATLPAADHNTATSQSTGLDGGSQNDIGCQLGHQIILTAANYRPPRSAGKTGLRIVAGLSFCRAPRRTRRGVAQIVRVIHARLPQIGIAGVAKRLGPFSKFSSTTAKPRLPGSPGKFLRMRRKKDLAPARLSCPPCFGMSSVRP